MTAGGVRGAWALAAMLGSSLLAACPAPLTPCPAGDGPLRIRQLALDGPAIGVSTLVELPGGGRLLVDVGNDSHDAAIRDAAGDVDFVLVTHGDEDHAGGLDDLGDVLADATRIDGLGVVELGDGVLLEVFVARGIVRTPDGDVDLRAEVEDLDTSENANSLAAVLRWGDFAWLFAGDLTGGGKGTPDVESAVAARGAGLLAAGSVDVVSLNHHGNRSSTNAAWVDWLLPEDGRTRHALSNGNGVYLAAPHEEVLDRVAPRLGGGAVWVGVPGSLTPDAHPALRQTGAEVVVDVDGGGASYRVCGSAVVQSTGADASM